MSRTTLCAVTAAVLALLSVAIMVVRYQVMGDELRRPRGHGAWKVTLAVHGTSLGSARVATAIPLDLDRQQVDNEVYESEQLFKKPPEAKHPERRVVLWSQRGGSTDGPFRLRCEYSVSIDGSPRSTLLSRSTNSLYAAPRPGEYLGTDNETRVNDEEISATARRLTAVLENPTNQHDVAEALYRFVANDIKNDPVDGPSASSVECLRNQRGDRLAQSRLLLALLRNRGIPARLVTGWRSAKGSEQRPHFWVEAWVLRSLAANVSLLSALRPGALDLSGLRLRRQAAGARPARQGSRLRVPGRASAGARCRTPPASRRSSGCF